MPGYTFSTLALLIAGAAGFLLLRWRALNSALEGAVDVGVRRTNYKTFQVNIASDDNLDGQISEHPVLVRGTI